MDTLERKFWNTLASDVTLKAFNVMVSVGYLAFYAMVWAALIKILFFM